MPSNLAIGARIWIARIAIVWGIVSMATLFAVGPRSFSAFRFLLGAAEAGFFPGIVFYFTYWFPARERARAVAQFSIASMAAGIFGAPLSGSLLSLRGVGGLDGWQWLLLIEGMPAVVLGVIALAYLDDGPTAARWLPDDEKAWLLAALQQEHDDRSQPRLSSVRVGLLDPGVWRLAFVLFLIVTSGYGFSFFLPQIVKQLSGGSNVVIGLLTALPFIAGGIGMITVAAHSDRTGERRWHVAACAAAAAIGLAASSLTGSAVLALAALCVGAVGLYSATPPFWSLPTAFLRGAGAAAGIGLVNSVGNLGGFVGPYVMGWMQGASGDFRIGLRVLSVSALCSGLLVQTARPIRP